MKILWLFLVIHTALAQPGFGRSYLRNSRLCHQWSCINTKLGLSDSLPTSEEFGNVLRRLLPSGEWQGVVDKVLNTCYHDRPRRYSNTCPGQAILHCAFDQLVANCPETSLRKDDACAPVNSLAGVNTMFTQSRYENLEANLALERRPAWFLKNYFNTKCCNLPAIINATLLSECKFTSTIQYYVHNPRLQSHGVLPSQRRASLPPSNNGNSLHIVSLKDFQTGNFHVTDPLECCDMSPFIQPSWRQECHFDVTWEAQRRLVVNRAAPVSSTEAVTTSTSRPIVRRDLMIVPQSCEKETCVFNKLNIISNGSVDITAFSKLLNNLTSSHPEWTSAKGRVVTTCLRKPLTEYEASCEINKILACTFDVLTENCPNAKKNDLCKHTKTDRICQISSSKYRPKNRRDTCILPELVERSVLTECGLHSLSKVQQAQTVSQPKKYKLFSKYSCLDLTPSTTCVLTKMGVLNKYGFTDYFKMKEHIRHLGSDGEWSPLVNVTLAAFSNGPLYREHCNSPRKFLNVLDSMLLTCPVSKRKNTAQCTHIFNQIKNTPANTNVTQAEVMQILNHFHHVFFPSGSNIPHKVVSKHTKKIVKKPIFDYGILTDKYMPKVTTIDIEPKVHRPLVLLPVYMRIPHSNLAVRPFPENGILRSPFYLHNHIAQAQASSITQPNSTTSTISTMNEHSQTVKPQ